MARMNFRIEGMGKLQKSLKKLGKVPQKHVTSSSKKAMNIVLKESRGSAPYETGNLQKGIKLAGEKSRKKGKKVYRVVFDSSMNDVFQKKNSDGKVTGYYPVSQEYGFFARSGKYIPGYRFIHDSLTDNTHNVQKTIVEEMSKKINQELSREGLR